MHLLAHRGFHAVYPENSMPAFYAAQASGFEGIETDVRISADNQLILCHDRIAPNGLPVSALTRVELESQLEHGVPTLEEALEAFPDLYWNIEIKVIAALPQSMTVLKHFQQQRHILVTSFRHDIAIECAKHLEVECGLLIANRPAALSNIIHGALPENQLRTIVWDFEIIDPTQLQLANSIGFRNFVYGAHTQFEHDACYDFGVHGLITDHPQMVGLDMDAAASLTRH